MINQLPSWTTNISITPYMFHNVITVPADALIPYGAISSAGTAVIIDVYMFPS